MTDETTRLRWTRKPTAAQPLIGITILAVEDSRFASEALRLACMRSGARLRRADCLASARRHLAVYRPSVVLVDLGLPDGCGTELIADLAHGDVEPPVIIAMSGDESGKAAALEAGASGFFAKPMPSLSGFQAEILSHLPAELRPSGPRPATTTEMEPDQLAYRDDLKRAADALGEGHDGRAALYAAQFVRSVAQSAKDTQLVEAAQRFARSCAAGRDVDLAHGHLCSAVAARLAEVRPF